MFADEKRYRQQILEELTREQAITLIAAHLRASLKHRNSTGDGTLHGCYARTVD